MNKVAARQVLAECRAELAAARECGDHDGARTLLIVTTFLLLRIEDAPEDTPEQHADPFLGWLMSRGLELDHFLSLGRDDRTKAKGLVEIWAAGLSESFRRVCRGEERKAS